MISFGIIQTSQAGDQLAVTKVILPPENTHLLRKGSITAVQLTSCLTGLD